MVLTAYWRCCIVWFDMRKNELIKQLQAIEGNPEVMLWNGLVGDFVPIRNVGKEKLTKWGKETWMLYVKREDVLYKRQPVSDEDLEKMYSEIGYEYNRYVEQEDIEKGLYKQKTIAFIQPKVVGKPSISFRDSIYY